MASGKKKKKKNDATEANNASIRGAHTASNQIVKVSKMLRVLRMRQHHTKQHTAFAESLN